MAMHLWALLGCGIITGMAVCMGLFPLFACLLFPRALDTCLPQQDNDDGSGSTGKKPEFAKAAGIWVIVTAAAWFLAVRFLQK
jgi:hypothetical protein